MKNKILLFIGAIALLSFTMAGGGKTKSTFTVYGVCGMCETKIEKTLNETKGVVWADWELETLELTVKYDASVISLDQIKQKLADVGYDSDSHRATDEAYNSLHACCKYERPKK